MTYYFLYRNSGRCWTGAENQTSCEEGMENSQNKLKLFENKKVRYAWNAEEEEWYFSVVDIVEVLTESKNYLTARKYWNKLKQRLKAEGSELVTLCHQLKLPASDGKMRLNNFPIAKTREARYNPIIGGANMTVVVNNASEMFVQALKAMAKIDGASVYLDDYGYYSKRTVKSVLKADKQMQKERAKGKLKLYDSVDELFGDL